ncbi:hypothetical protein BBOV_II006200 [Babesia bovis T2Bo]|uniref:Membrane protein, putative n=1 Tax=Babesia bovis TaxID=5865 RepID=A7AUF9_BABBO|nr:hypothetical protein BBOV_II006200 [Babesia bovis T2Bo]EDO06570.1 hypothetical protein BBOV_II006200 [Babesia bovis T2Bo]|eukprot:XP_001610138.1 membrane protein [Babesia bovis T2Bo]
MRLWLLFYVYVFQIANSYLISSGHTNFLSSLSTPGTRVTRTNAKSLLDDPLLLAPSTEPGGEHHLVLSNSPAFGIQRTLYTHRRNVRAQGPLYNTGQHVYLVSGPYRNARGTVLSTFRRGPGEPHLVSVVLDCRNELGIVPVSLSHYHGTRITVWENQLVDRPPYTPHSPPSLYNKGFNSLDQAVFINSPQRSARRNLSSIVERIINTINLDGLESCFDQLCRMDIFSPYPYMSLIVQLVRKLQMDEDRARLGVLVNAVLLRLANDTKLFYTVRQRSTIPWFTWALSVLRMNHLLNGWESYDKLNAYIGSVLLNGYLTDLTQGEINLMAMGFRFHSSIRKEVLHRLAMLFSHLPASTIIMRHASGLAMSLNDAGIVHPGFNRLLCEMIKNQYSLPSEQGAVCLLKYLSCDPNTPQAIKDELLACCSVSSFLDPRATPYGPSYKMAITLAQLSDREMSELLHAINTGEVDIPLSVIKRCIFSIDLSPSTVELLSLLVKKGAKHFEKLGGKAQHRILTLAPMLNGCPSEVIDAVERDLGAMHPSCVLDPEKAYALGKLLPSIPESRVGVQKLILRRLEHFLESTLSLLRENAMSPSIARAVMIKATSFLQAITYLGYELPSLARNAATLLREGIGASPDRTNFLLALVSVQAMCPNYFNEASRAARALLKDPGAEVPSDVRVLSELLLSVKQSTEGEASCSSLVGHIDIPALPPEVVKDGIVRPSKDVRDFSLLFLLLVRSGLFDDRGGILNTAYVFAEDNLHALSSIDLLMLRDALVSVDAFDSKWEGLLASVPKGIDAVT